MIAFGVSGLPPDGVDDAGFLDALVRRGDRAFELSFTSGFPWKEDRCRQFGALAAERGLALSIHAPYFAILTVEDEERPGRILASVEHTMKLGAALGARVVVAHAGYTKDRPPHRLHELADASLHTLEPKVRHLGVALGLETSGTRRGFGSLGDIALIAADHPFVHPVVDWAHLHAMSNGSLTTTEAFLVVFAFLREEFPGWALDPVHCQFSDNRFGPGGEIAHVPYGEGTLRVTPLVEAALSAGVRMTFISESRDDASHDAVRQEVKAALGASRARLKTATGPGVLRPLPSGGVGFPTILDVMVEGQGATAPSLDRPLSLSNIDKQFFSNGYTKGDLLQYYASIAPLLLPHLRDRAIVLARFPDGADGEWFYEKQAPSHAPAWLATAPMWSEHRSAPIDFVLTSDLPSLLWIANTGAIEIHPWLSRVATADSPDMAVFDLDPAEDATWDQVVEVAGLVRVALDRLGLVGYPKTSGATGIHIYVPLDPVHDYRRVRRLVEAVGRHIVAAAPNLATMEWDIPKRGGRIFIDHNQNVAGKTIASVYSVRPRTGAPVSTPLLWDEVGKVRPEDFTIDTIWPRISAHGDLFAPVLRGGQQLDAAERGLGI